MSGATVRIERFFQLSLLGLVASGYLAVAGSGFLDLPTVVLTAAGLMLRALCICGLVKLRLSERGATTITLLYAVFFAVDYLALRGEELGPPPEQGPARLLVAARVGGTRLIDNVAVAQ